MVPLNNNINRKSRNGVTSSFLLSRAHVCFTVTQTFFGALTKREFGINYTKIVMKNICYFIGSYIYIEASPQRSGDVARLLSEWMEPNQSACVQFWYHMYGSDIGNLSFYLKTNKSETLVWRLSSDQGDRWKFGQFSLSSERAHRVCYT